MEELDRAVVEITVKMGSKEYNFNLHEQLDINKDDIDRELTEQPGKFAWFGVLAEMAYNKSLRKEDAIEVAEAEADRKIRRRYAKKGEKPPEKQIEKMIRRDEKVRMAKREFFDAKRDASVLFVAKKAFEQRKDMLASVTVNLRKQGMPGDPELEEMKAELRKRKRTGKH